MRQQQRRYHQRNRWQQLLMTAVHTRWFPNTTWTCLAAAWLSSRYVSAMIRIMLSWSKPHPAWLEREQVLYIVWRALLDQEKCCGHVKTMTVNSSCFCDPLCLSGKLQPKLFVWEFRKVLGHSEGQKLFVRDSPAEPGWLVCVLCVSRPCRAYTAAGTKQQVIKQRPYMEEDESFTHVAHQKNHSKICCWPWVTALVFLAFRVQSTFAAGAHGDSFPLQPTLCTCQQTCTLLSMTANWYT